MTLNSVAYYAFCQETKELYYVWVV